MSAWSKRNRVRTPTHPTKSSKVAGSLIRSYAHPLLFVGTEFGIIQDTSGPNSPLLLKQNTYEAQLVAGIINRPYTHPVWCETEQEQ